MLHADSGFKKADVSMCTSEDFKSILAGTQEIILFTTAAMLCKQVVTSKQEEGGMIGVCHVVWITDPRLIPEEELIQLQRGDHFQFTVE